MTSKAIDFIKEFVEAWDDGMGGDSSLYSKAKTILAELDECELNFTESEVIVLREAVRKYPRGNDFVTLYDEEFSSTDRKLTYALALKFDEHNKVKQ
jgi:hypothetical protein